MYDYVCGVCQTVSHHGTRAEAEGERAGHRLKVHHGRTPVREWIRDNAALAALAAREARRPYPGMPVWERVLRWLARTTYGRWVLVAAGVWLVFVINALTPPPR